MTKTPHDPHAVLVAGAGPVGLAAALAMSRAGFSVSLIGPEANREDRRTTALMVPALDYLGSLGIDAGFGGRSAPLRTMRIIDATGRLVRSPTVTFHASEINRDAFGANIPNAVLLEVLGEAVAKAPGITRIEESVKQWDLREGDACALLDDGSRVDGTLAIAADGRASPAREAAGIRTLGHPYPQSALVLSFKHTRPHGDTSNEFHTETGPFTQVPLPGLASSLVWVVRPSEADALMALDDAALAARIEARMQSMLGKVTLLPGRQLYPLSARMPVSFARSRVALVGEAAHVFPPIGAQGLNLGLRDVEALETIIQDHKDDPGQDAVLQAYNRARRPDVMARNGAVNLLNRSLLSSMLPAQMARSAGLTLLDSFSPLRGFFMREGMRPGGGLRGLWEQVGRDGA
jgi:2-octaprenyl-6-methoxyphenol hydroxylase